MADNFPDLILTDNSKPLEQNKNDYFLVTITNLIPGKTYPVEFRWNYKDPSQKGDWGAVLNIVTPSYAPNAVSNLNASWINEIFTLSFTHDRSLAQNSNVLQYKIKIVAADSTERVFYHAPKTGSSQVFTLEYSKIVEAFGIPLYAFSGSVIAIDKNGNESTAVTFPLTTALTSLPAPVITVASATGGYTVTYTTPSATTYPNYSHINIEEVESSAGSDPGSGYSTVFSGVANPVILSRSGSAQRWVRARFISKLGLPGAYSTAYAVTPTPAVVVDTIAPSAPGSGSLTAGIDNSSGATIGFNAYVDVSWTAVSDSTLRGYRLRFRRDGSSDPYSYVDSPGTGTSFRLSGLAIGTTYEIAVASYDEINNTSSSYTSLGTATATGTPFIGKNVTTQGYFGASASGDTGEFRFGYGVESGRRGLRFDANNYWYIDSSAAASFRLGGSANNYLQWNGSTFTIDGDLTARSGAFRGNVQIVSGSLFAGASASSGARLAISSTGLTAYDSNGTATTNIYSNANAGGVTFDTIAGTIGNWSITNSSITKTQGSGTLTLNSSNARITASGTTAAYVVGMAAPTNNAPSDIVLYAGSTTPGSAPFRVRADGAVTMTSATITGYVGASDVVNHIGGLNTTTISGGVITTGTINLNNVSINNSATGSRISLDSTGLKAYSGATNTVAINSDGSASFTGTITGSVITTTGGNSYGAVRMNTSTDAFEFLYSGSVVGSLYTFNAGSEILIQKGSPTSIGYATNTGFMSIYSTGVSLGRTNTSGILSTGFNIDGSGGGVTALVGSSGFIVSGGPIYTGTNTTTATDQSEGISLTQGGTLSARRSNANPLNLHRFNVTAATTTSVSVIDFYRNGTARGTLEIFGNTSAPVLVGSSDYRLKENIRDYTGGLDKILATKVRIFNEIEDEDKNDIVGFVAHEFSEIFPDFVSGEKDAIDLEGNPIYQKLSHSNMVPYLVSAIQELSKRLDELEG